MKRILSIIVFFLLVLSACAAPMPVPPTLTHEPTSTIIPTATMIAMRATVTLTAVPSATVTSLPAGPGKTQAPTRAAIPFPSRTSTAVGGSPTPSIPIVLSLDGKDVQCSKGPVIESEPRYTFKTAEIVGKDATSQWWYIKMYDKLGNPLFCWVNVNKTGTAGILSNVPVTEAEAASVTSVSISLDGDNTQTVACGQSTENLEFHFTGKIVTNGPIAGLRYQWETNAGPKFSTKQIQVLAWDNPARPQINISVPAQAGIYSLTLRTINPNEMVQVMQFGVKCQ